MEIGFATRFDDRHVGIHHHVFRAGKLFDLRTAGAVIEMGMTDQKNLEVAEFEAQLFHAIANEWHAAFEIGINENVAFARGDQITRQAFAADVVQIPGNAKRRKRRRPGAVRFRMERSGGAKRNRNYGTPCIVVENVVTWRRLDLRFEKNSSTAINSYHAEVSKRLLIRLIGRARNRSCDTSPSTAANSSRGRNGLEM